MTRLLTIIITGLTVAGITAVTTASGGQQPPNLGEPVTIEATTPSPQSDEAQPTQGVEQPARRAADSVELTTVADDEPDRSPGPGTDPHTSDNKASWITKITQPGADRDATSEPQSRDTTATQPTGTAEQASRDRTGGGD